MKLAFPPFAVLALLAASGSESAYTKSGLCEDYAHHAVAYAPTSTDKTLDAPRKTPSYQGYYDLCMVR